MPSRKKQFTGFKHRVLGLIRRAFRWNQVHTGSEVASVSVIKWKTRVRKFAKKASFQIRKKAKFVVPHFSPPIAPNNVIQLKLVTRKGKKLKQKRRRASYQLLKTGLQPSVALVHFQARKRKGKVKRGRRMSSFYNIGHTGLSPVVTTTGTWVASYINRRGGDS